MIQNSSSIYSFSPLVVASSIPNENMDSTMESDISGAEWSGPQNQLGLDPEYPSRFQQDVLQPEDQFGLRRDNEAVALDKKGEINHHEVIAKYRDLT